VRGESARAWHVAVRQEHQASWTERNPLGAVKEEARARDTEVRCHLRARGEPQPPRRPCHRAAVDLTGHPRALASPVRGGRPGQRGEPHHRRNDRHGPRHARGRVRAIRARERGRLLPCAGGLARVERGAHGKASRKRAWAGVTRNRSGAPRCSSEPRGEELVKSPFRCRRVRMEHRAAGGRHTRHRPLRPQNRQDAPTSTDH
jgi:hypothetical protein